ncbi:angiopoietin-related protein 2-like [Sitophilus oryzae]|uniref:Angiopoietin-related protein 2-like n=1 Tax=Sitophilus oryzae TaxID=7048 RepID=A0A6J2YRJ3_SITOR|nr:angiopoietin-related protein 2-like [Sitophilus oryzae]
MLLLPKPVIFSVFLCLFGVRESYSLEREKTTLASSCDLRNVENRLQMLERSLQEQINVIRNEIRDSSRSIEYQNRAIRNVVEDYKKEIRRVVERPRRYDINQRNPNENKIDERIDEIDRGVKLTIATLRLLSSDVASLKFNVSRLENNTNSLLDKIDVHSAIDTVFSAQSPKSTEPSSGIPTNCAWLKLRNVTVPSGVYLIQPETAERPFPVYCEMQTQDGGWSVIHNRYQGSQDFALGWQDYKNGFGNIAGESWLGLEKIHQLTGSNLNELLIELIDPNNINRFAYYSSFSVGSEEEGYALKVLSGYQGNAGNSLMYHAGSKFSTMDRDQDTWHEGNCAQSHNGGWWYKSCDKSNLNAKYMPGNLPDLMLYQGMYWGEFGGPQVGLLQARMMIRPSSYQVPSPEVA